MTTHNIEELNRRAKLFGIETDPNKRWEQGIPHHPKAKEVFKDIRISDWAFGNDYFCWKVGGDGDNGETLMYALSIYYELLDAEKVCKCQGFYRHPSCPIHGVKTCKI